MPTNSPGRRRKPFRRRPRPGSRWACSVPRRTPGAHCAPRSPNWGTTWWRWPGRNPPGRTPASWSTPASAPRRTRTTAPAGPSRTRPWRRPGNWPPRCGPRPPRSRTSCWARKRRTAHRTWTPLWCATRCSDWSPRSRPSSPAARCCGSPSPTAGPPRNWPASSPVRRPPERPAPYCGSAPAPCTSPGSRPAAPTTVPRSPRARRTARR